MASSFNVVKMDIEKALKSWDDGKIEEHEITQIEFFLKHINANLEKLQTYVISGIKDIGKNNYGLAPMIGRGGNLSDKLFALWADVKNLPNRIRIKKDVKK